LKVSEVFDENPGVEQAEYEFGKLLELIADNRKTDMLYEYAEVGSFSAVAKLQSIVAKDISRCSK
jgi:hypothetical protein